MNKQPDYQGTVHVIPYTHADMAWVHTRAWHIDRYARVMDEVLEAMEVDPDFRYYVDTWTELAKPYLKLRPDKAAIISKRIRTGQLAVCGGHYGNVRSAIVGDETFVRNLKLGMRHWTELAPDARLMVYANMDVCVGHTQVPQLLSLAGLTCYFTTRPLESLDDQGKPRTFFWKGLSGDEVLVCRSMYGGLFLPEERHGDTWDADWDSVVSGILGSYIGPATKEPVGHVALCVGSDDNRPDRFNYWLDRKCDYAEMIRLWNERQPGTMRYSTPNEFFDALLANRESIPTVGGVLDPCDNQHNVAVHGRGGIWWLREFSDRLLVDAEIWSTLASLTTGFAYPEAELTADWEQLLDWTPHAVQWLFRDDWRQGRYALESVARSAEACVHRALAHMAGETLPRNAGGLAVFNPLPRPRRELTPIWIINTDLTRDLAGITDSSGGEVAFQVIDRPMQHCELSIVADVDSPACGFETLRLHWEPIPEGLKREDMEAHWRAKYGSREPGHITDKEIDVSSDRVRINLREGHIVRVEDLLSGVAAVAPQGASFLEPGYFRPDIDNWAVSNVPDNPEPFVPKSVRWQEEGPLRWRLVRTGTTGPCWVRQELDLYKGEPAVRSTVRFMDASENVSSYLTMGIPVSEGSSFEADIPFGVEPRDPAACNVAYYERIIAGLFYARTWVSADDGRAKLSLVAEDGDKFFRAHGSPMRLLHILARKFPLPEHGWEAYIDTCCLESPQVFRHRMVLAQAGSPNTNLADIAQRIRHPMRSIWAASECAEKRKELLRVSPDTVALSALNREGDHVMIRVVQLSDEAAEAAVELPFRPSSVEQVNFRGDSLPANARVEGNSIRFGIAPWRIVTLRICP